MNKKPQKTVLLDYDGVLTDFYGGAEKLVGRPGVFRDVYLHSDDPRQGANDLLKDGIWDAVTEAGADWWENLEALPWAKTLWTKLNEISKVCICTSFGNLVTHPTFSANAAAGKVLWTKKHLDTNRIAICPRKELLAHPNAILIDDCERNIKAFDRSGGIGKLWMNQYELEQLDWESYVQGVCDAVRNA